MRLLLTVLVCLTLGAPVLLAQRPVASSVARKESLRIGVSPTSAGMRVGENRRTPSPI
jgi:hypothetical protein